jgi:hypothetical protein
MIKKAARVTVRREQASFCGIFVFGVTMSRTKSIREEKSSLLAPLGKRPRSTSRSPVNIDFIEPGVRVKRHKPEPQIDTQIDRQVLHDIKHDTEHGAEQDTKDDTETESESESEQNTDDEESEQAPRRVTPRVGDSKTACWEGYEVDKLLGEGSSASVYAACKEDGKDCNYAVKVSELKDESDEAIADRDLYFLRKLQPLKVGSGASSSFVVPRLYDWWICSRSSTTEEEAPELESESESDSPSNAEPKEPIDEMFIVLEKFDSDMTRFGLRSLDKAPSKWRSYISNVPRVNANSGVPTFIRLRNDILFTNKQLVRMFALLNALSDNGVIHGDCKPDAFLQRNDGQDIVVADFGLSGDQWARVATTSSRLETKLGPATANATAKQQGRYSPTSGWASSEDRPGALRCPFDLRPFARPDLMQVFNVWQLVANLTIEFRTWVVEEAAGEKSKVFLFNGFTDQMEIDKRFSRLCPGYGQDVRIINEEHRLLREQGVQFISL